ncbi:MAG TPA: sugar phosphate isomerase/epimerase family protein [Bacillota bacterium]|jgi:sugar phosphate isomerase/epimerase|nr:sugar phosphate isomerase/epimerase family protein [Bacillota bacterium]
MKISIVVNATPRATGLAADLPLEDAVALAAKVGYDGVELAVGDPRDLDVGTVRQTLSMYGMGVPAIGTGAAYRQGLSLAHADGSRRAGAIERLKDHVDVGAELGAAVIVGLIRGRTADGLPPREGLARISEGLQEVAGYAARQGVRLFLEPINRYETDLLNTVSDALTTAREAGENVGLLVDTFHMNIEDSSIARAIRDAAPRIWHVHVADSNRRAPGAGHIDFGEVIEALKDIGYQGYVSGEMIMEPDAPAAFSALYSHLAPMIARYICEAGADHSGGR